MNSEYSYHKPGSELNVKVIVIVLIGVMFFAVSFEILSPAMAFTAFLIITIAISIRSATGPTSGMAIDVEEVTLYSGKWRAAYPLEKIDHFRIVDWADGVGFEIHTKDLKHLSIPRRCYGEPSKLQDYLERQNFKIIEQEYEENEK